MRRRALFLLMVLQVPPSHAAEEKAPPFDISVIVSWADKQKLRSVCGAKNRGCTRFTGNRLAANCLNTSSEWTIRAEVTIVAVMVLPQPGVIYQAAARNHEDLHVQDVREDVTRYLLGLQARRFASEGECQEAANLESARFRETIAEFAMASSRKRD